MDDLDSMLDEALDVIDAQDEEQKKKREETERRVREDEERVRSRTAAAAAAAAQQQQAGEGGPDEAALLQTLMSLMNVMKGGPEALDSIDSSQLQHIHGTLGSMLESVRSNATPEEEAELKSCFDMLQKAQQLAGSGDGKGATANDGGSSGMTEEDDAKLVAELLKGLETMNHGGAGGAPSAGAATAAERDMPPELAQMMEELARINPALSAATAMGGGSSSSSSGASATALDQEAELMKALFDPETLAEPFRAIVGLWPAWFAQHRASTSAEDLERYEKQEAQMKLVCSILDEANQQGDSNEDDKSADVTNQGEADSRKSAKQLADGERLVRLTSALERLQSFGMPPPSLYELLSAELAAKGKQ